MSGLKPAPERMSKGIYLLGSLLVFLPMFVVVVVFVSLASVSYHTILLLLVLLLN